MVVSLLLVRGTVVHHHCSHCGLFVVCLWGSVTQFRSTKISKFFCKMRTFRSIQNCFPWQYIWLSRILQFSWCLWTDTEM